MKETIATLGEFGLIERIKAQFPSSDGVVGIGDDCAVLPQQSDMDSLVSTDLLVEGIHFLRHDIHPYQLGWKSAAVNVSDVAAMGGRPTGTFLSIALPQDLEVKWIDEFIRGYKALSDRFGVPLLGGDTTRSLSTICINVGVMGQIAHNSAKLRSHAQVGDLICVTGPLGDSGAGLQVILESLERDSDAVTLINRHYSPTPQVEAGIALAQTPGVHAMMDISDGIGSDIRHILKSSHVGAEIDIFQLPMSPELKRLCKKHHWEPIHFAISGGEDYQLLFTMSPNTKPTISHTIVGRIVEGDSLIWLNATKDYCGFRHF